MHSPPNVLRVYPGLTAAGNVAAAQTEDNHTIYTLALRDMDHKRKAGT